MTQWEAAAQALTVRSAEAVKACLVVMIPNRLQATTLKMDLPS